MNDEWWRWWWIFSKSKLNFSLCLGRASWTTTSYSLVCSFLLFWSCSLVSGVIQCDQRSMSLSYSASHPQEDEDEAEKKVFQIHSRLFQIFFSYSRCSVFVYYVLGWNIYIYTYSSMGIEDFFWIVPSLFSLSSHISTQLLLFCAVSFLNINLCLYAWL